jgi:hypothetical protein
LESLARRALEASQLCDGEVATKLLKLAEFACQSLTPTPSALLAQIQKALAALIDPARASGAPRSEGPASPRGECNRTSPHWREADPRSKTLNPEATSRSETGDRVISDGDPEQSEGGEPRSNDCGSNVTTDVVLKPGHNAAAANQLYLAAVDLLKR